MNKIISYTALLISLIFLSACSVSEKPETSPPPQQQASVIDNSDPTGEAIIEVMPRMRSNIPTKKYIEPEPPKQRALSHKERFSGVLGAHNKVRAKHKLPPLKWSSQLAIISQNWANTLGKNNHCQMYHHKGTPPFGENLYRSSAIVWSDGVREINPVTIKNVVKAWTDEEKWYDYKRNRCQPGKQCGHYTQAVWKGTKEVGCAMKVCADKSQTWVCSYFPAGNFTGARPY